MFCTDSNPKQSQISKHHPCDIPILAAGREPPGVTHREGQPGPAQGSLGTNFRENTLVSSDQMERGVQTRP